MRRRKTLPSAADAGEVLQHKVQPPRHLRRAGDQKPVSGDLKRGQFAGEWQCQFDLLYSANSSCANTGSLFPGPRLRLSLAQGMQLAAPRMCPTLRKAPATLRGRPGHPSAAGDGPRRLRSYGLVDRHHGGGGTAWTGTAVHRLVRSALPPCPPSLAEPATNPSDAQLTCPF